MWPGLSAQRRAGPRSSSCMVAHLVYLLIEREQRHEVLGAFVEAQLRVLEWIFIVLCHCCGGGHGRCGGCNCKYSTFFSHSVFVALSFCYDIVCLSVVVKIHYLTGACAQLPEPQGVAERIVCRSETGRFAVPDWPFCPAMLAVLRRRMPLAACRYAFCRHFLPAQRYCL